MDRAQCHVGNGGNGFVAARAFKIFPFHFKWNTGNTKEQELKRKYLPKFFSIFFLLCYVAFQKVDGKDEKTLWDTK